MSTPTPAPAPARGATGAVDRALAPDLARGVMLLAIAVAHAPLFVTAVERGPALANDIAGVFHLLFVHNHARPMFAFLYGYALVQLYDRQTRRGADWPRTRRLLRRRGWWLAAIGFAHVVLLVPIDILAAYGIAGVLLVGLLRARDATLLWTGGVLLVPATLLTAMSVWLPLTQGVSSYTVGSIAAGDRGAVEMLADRLAAWPFGLAVAVVSVAPAVVFGMWAARRRYLEEPERHRGLLVRFTAAATGVSVLGALPAAAMQAGVWADPPAAAVGAASLVQPLTGYFGGIAMAGAVALAAIAAARSRGPLTTALQALGQRSMTVYLAQSVVFTFVFFPFGLGLQDDLGLAGATAVAAASWVAAVVAADLMRRAGRRGPAEVLLRWLAYPRRPRAGSA
ncbi:putative membrane protein YeiB [Streptomonospora nanhaiensis]|uniref:Putative membrane protein YeiB n=1 Tax=Streptomonospora nanhaiensis TaxID=1323731 RepID=A0A853BKT9_9ACTN|nr:putative membrane protein YeiB [Streptomonospora nanhaiensis]